MTDTKLKCDIEKLISIIEDNPTDWPWVFAGILDDTRFSDETREEIARFLDEICEYSSVEDAKRTYSSTDKS